MNKNNSILFLLLLVISSHGLCQEKSKAQPAYKSIAKRNLKLDQSVPTLLTDARKLMITDTKLALDKVEEALALSIKEKSKLNEARCYLLLGDINQHIEEWELATNNYVLAFDLLKKDYVSTKEYRQSLDGLSKALLKQEDYEKALNYLTIKLETAGNPEVKTEAHLAIANLWFEKGDLKKALDALKNAEKIIDQEGLTEFQGQKKALEVNILAQLGDVVDAEALYQSSQPAYDLTIQEVLEEETDDAFESSKEELISAYEKQDEVNKGIRLRNQSIQTNTRRGNTLKVLKEKQVLSEALIKTGSTAAAIRELKDAVHLADSLQDLRELAKAYRGLAEAWNTQGDKEKSLEAYRNYSDTMDQLFFLALKEEENKSKIIKKQQSITSLSKEMKLDETEFELERTSNELEIKKINFQLLVIYGLLFLLLVLLITSWFIYRNAQKSRIMGELLALKSLRSQMNPHFIFNALNSVNQFIAMNDERAANKFLAEFSKLMRMVLDNSQLDFIPLADEKAIISLYLKLEHYRFRDRFEYTLDIEESIPLDTCEIPPMLVQPYIENAIWHGLRYKETKGHLDVKVYTRDEVLKIEISDDGIGRTRSKALKTKHQKTHRSTGLRNTEERIKLINKVYKKNYKVFITDLHGDESGTKVVLSLPLNGR